MTAHVATAAVALLSAALTVGAGPAYAAPSDGPTVEFSGGSVLNLLVCKSEPSAGQVSVPAETRVTFANRLGQAATLKVDGKAVTQVGANQAVPVVFHYGPVNVSMTFSCGVGVVEQFKAVGVTVTPSAAGLAATTAKSATGASGGAGTPHAGSAPTAGSRTPSGAGAAHSAAGGIATDQGENSRSDGRTEPIDPSLLGTDPSAVPPAGAAPPSGTDDRVFVEAAVPASGTQRNAPAGLLALIATVCVLGVAMAAIRAIIAQRSTRTGFA